MRIQIAYACSSTNHKLLCRKLNEIVKNIDSKSNHGRLRRFAEGKKDEEDIAGFVEAISDLVTNLQVSSAFKSQKRL